MSSLEDTTVTYIFLKISRFHGQLRYVNARWQLIGNGSSKPHRTKLQILGANCTFSIFEYFLTITFTFASTSKYYPLLVISYFFTKCLKHEFNANLAKLNTKILWESSIHWFQIALTSAKKQKSLNLI